MPYNNLAFLQRLIVLLQWYITNYDNSSPKKLFITSVCSLGRDASPNDVAPDEFGCAETVDEIHRKAIGNYICGIGPTLSTRILYTKFKSDTVHWNSVTTPNVGDIVISPTGYGTNPDMSSGHIGFIGLDRKIMSNNSYTGLFEENYTLDTWRERYVVKGGYPMLFYRRS